MFEEEIGLTVDGKGTDLDDAGGEVDAAGCEGLGDMQRLIFKLQRGDEHVLTLCKYGVQVNCISCKDARRLAVRASSGARPSGGAL